VNGLKGGIARPALGEVTTIAVNRKVRVGDVILNTISLTKREFGRILLADSPERIRIQNQH
jgi:hypothetical protein